MSGRKDHRQKTRLGQRSVKKREIMKSGGYVSNKKGEETSADLAQITLDQSRKRRRRNGRPLF